MDDAVLPLQTFLFQSLFLIISIALESRVFYKRLILSRKASIEYATILNLLAASVGWLVFFTIQNWIPPLLKDQLVSYIFFDRLLGSHPENLIVVITATGIVLFIGAFLVKLQGLELLEALLEQRGKNQDKPELIASRRYPTLADRLGRTTTRNTPNHATTILLANAYSHSAILLLLFLRFIQIHALI